MTAGVKYFPLCLPAVSYPHYRRILEGLTASKQPPKLGQVGEVVGSKLARVSVREGEGRSAGSINRSHSAQSTAAGQEYLNSVKAQGMDEGLSRKPA